VLDLISILLIVTYFLKDGFKLNLFCNFILLFDFRLGYHTHDQSTLILGRIEPNLILKLLKIQ
jgi:hypothetical protein